jgi:hypothetical protein
VVDADTSDDMIVDVAEDSQARGGRGGLSAAVTSLPANVQMIGYRLMWALAGVISIGAAAISYFLRDPESEEEVQPRPAAAPPARRARASVAR